MIAENLPLAVEDGSNAKRVKQWLMPSSSLAWHSTTHSWLCSCDGAPAGRFLQPATCVCNAVLLPHVQVFNSKVAARVCVTVLLPWALT